MAERRMFSKSIIGSGRFLRMPQSSRLLYYDLGMYADDDGVVEAFSVLRQTNANEDDLRVLVSKGFVNVLNEELVSVICDWKTNNSIRQDRYHPSIYADLLVQLNNDNQLTTNCQPSDNQMETEVRLGKDSIGKDSIGKRFKKPTVEELQSYIDEKSLNVNAEKFYDYYESNGWKVGKNSMKDWKATLRNWSRNNDNTGNRGKANRTAEEIRRDEELEADIERIFGNL